MPNAEGRMEDAVDIERISSELSNAIGNQAPTELYPGGRVYVNAKKLSLVLAALAAARAENEKLREALAHYANAVNWMSHTDADAMLRVWIGSGDGPDYARRALAAQEGTDG